MDDDRSLSSDDILAAFRARKEGKKPIDELQPSDSKASGLKDLFGSPPKRTPEPAAPSTPPTPSVEPDETPEPEPPAPEPDAASPVTVARPEPKPDPAPAASQPMPPSVPAPAAPPLPKQAAEPAGRPCGCGARGPHRAECPLAGAAKPRKASGGAGIQRVLRNCSCGFTSDWPAAWALHKKSCGEPEVSEPQRLERPRKEPPRSHGPEPNFPLQTVTAAQLKARAAGQPLTALEPVMGLADRLLEDTTITVRGHVIGRRVGLGVGVLGLLIMVLERRAVWITGDRYVLADIGLPILALGVVFLLLGAGAFAGFWFWPPARTLGVRLAESQAKEWDRVQEEVKLWGLLQWVGLGMLGGGALFTVLSYSALPDAQVLTVVALSLAIAIAGGGMLFAAFVRRQALHRLYVQTLVLSRLEATGLGPGRMPEATKPSGPDERVGPVLKALDELLGALPDAAVNRFLSSKEAAAYLALIDEVNEANG